MDLVPIPRQTPILPPQPIAGVLLRERYLAPAERRVDDVRDRVAQALAAVEAPKDQAEWRQRFLWALTHGFVPGGRINRNAGRRDQGTLINCFVQPIRQAVDPACPDLATTLREATTTLGQGGGVGYDLSGIAPRDSETGCDRPSGEVGVAACLRALDANARHCGRDRRGAAQMAVLDVGHPDILDFVHAKAAAGALACFNLSVAIPDAFMHAVTADADYPLVHAAQPSAERIRQGACRLAGGRWQYARVPARHVWQQLLEAAYRGAEPGVLFIDAIRRENNLAYCESIAATNPCGEQPLPAYGACCLGSLDLTAFVLRPFEADASIDWPRLRRVIRLAVRMLDNVLTVTEWPLPMQREEALQKRRIGLGMTGLGDALVMLGARYDAEPGRRWARRIAATLRDTAYAASVARARERGAFACFDAERYLESGFARRLHGRLRGQIARYGIRNSHLTSIAPAGTISIAFADNVSSGVEPPYACRYHRFHLGVDGRQEDYLVEDHACRVYRALGHAGTPPAFCGAQDIDPAGHLRMLAAIAPYVDAGISKTINVPAAYPFDAFGACYAEAWAMGLKGLTTYRPNSARGQVLSDEGRACPSCGQPCA